MNAPAAILVTPMIRGNALAPASTAVPNRFAGLEILNRVAGNGRDPEPILAGASDAQIANFARNMASLSPAGTAGVHRVIIRYTDYQAPLNPEFLRDPSVKRALAAVRQQVISNRGPSRSLNLLSARRLVANLAKAVTTIHSDPARQSAMLHSLQSMRRAAESSAAGTKTIDVRLDTMAFAYMRAYLEGKFVDRNGTTISQPDISAKIGNDTLTAFEKVLLEAVYDYALMVPVVYEKSAAASPHAMLAQPTNAVAGKANSALMPTFAVLFPDLYETVSTNSDAKGVTAAELKFMTFLRGMGAEQSKHLSSVIIRFIGGVAFGGKLSVGDNDALSKAVSTFCNSFVEGTVNAISYNFFEVFQYSVAANGDFVANAEANQRNLGLPKELGDAIANALQYEDILATLLPSPASKSSSPQ